MNNLATKIETILREKGECLTAVEIELRLNAEFSGSGNPYTMREIVVCADRMPNVYRSGKEYCLRQVEV